MPTDVRATALRRRVGAATGVPARPQRHVPRGAAGASVARVERVVGTVLRRGDRVLLAHRSPTRRWYPDVWDVPGGHVEPGEDGPAALARELAEELGVDAAVSGEPFARVRAADFVMDVWLIDAWSGEPVNTAPGEHDALAWVGAGDLAGLRLAPGAAALARRALGAGASGASDAAAIETVVRAVVLDLDGTLLDHRGSARRALGEWLPALGVEPTDALATAWFEAEGVHHAAWARGEVSFAEQRRRRLRRFLPLIGRPVGDDADLDAVFAGYVGAYERAWAAYPDAADALAALRDAGLATAVLTNGTVEQQRAKLRACGLGGLVSPLLTSEELGAAKPDPAATARASAWGWPRTRSSTSATTTPWTSSPPGPPGWARSTSTATATAPAARSATT